MQFSLAILGAIALAQAAYVPSEPWTTLTPSATYSGASTNHTHSFGIQIVSITSTSSAYSSSAYASVSATAVAKRDVVNQIDDGQIQNQTSETLSTPSPTTATLVQQISDGQIQHQTTTASTSSTSTSSTKMTTATVVQQISDGQIQHQTTTTTSSSSSSTTPVTTASVVNQISDGQIQQQTTTTSATTADVVSQISDGQVQATESTSAEEEEYTGDFPVSCSSENSLTMVLKNGELKDSKGRIGAIVANRQFQFDGPPPQAGTIYAAGWSVTDDGYLALGDSDVFYQCLSGDFYNLYDQNVAAQCSPVHLEVIDFVSC